MDNEKRPEFLEKILRKKGHKAVNENPALDQERVLAPMKDELPSLPKGKYDSKKIEDSREKGSGSGRGMGGGGSASTPKQTEGEYKTPAQKLIEKGMQKPTTGSGSGGGGSIMKEPDEILRDKNDVVKPDDILSQQKPQQQQQKSAGKTQEPTPKINPREWMAKMLAANSPKEKENTKTVAKDTAKANIKGLIDKAVVDRNNAPAEKTVSKEKSKEVAMNITKTAPPKTIKR